MASGCAVISEKLCDQTLKDLGLAKFIIQIDSPKKLKENLKLLKSQPNLLKKYQEKSKEAIQKNTWHDRAEIMIQKFQEVCN